MRYCYWFDLFILKVHFSTDCEKRGGAAREQKGCLTYGDTLRKVVIQGVRYMGNELFGQFFIMVNGQEHAPTVWSIR